MSLTIAEFDSDITSNASTTFNSCVSSEMCKRRSPGEGSRSYFWLSVGARRLRSKYYLSESVDNQNQKTAEVATALELQHGSLSQAGSPRYTSETGRCTRFGFLPDGWEDSTRCGTVTLVRSQNSKQIIQYPTLPRPPCSLVHIATSTRCHCLLRNNDSSAAAKFLNEQEFKRVAHAYSWLEHNHFRPGRFN